MNKVVIALGCLLGLAAACIPAYANPTDKKITLTCSSLAPDNVKGSATVTLCETTNCGNTLGDDSITCPQVMCDTAGTISVTSVCSTDSAGTPFKVGAVSVNVCYQQDEEQQGATCTPHPGNGGGTAITGKGFATAVAPGGDSDTVSLTVK